MIQHIAVVTGANRGISLAIVRQLAQAGMKFIATSHDAEKGRAAGQKLAGQRLSTKPWQIGKRFHGE
jgi:NAD(P)-dependent dehydrogenase (short-subunit alcohol dehydrogenase family)